MICMQRTFGQPVIVPPGNSARSASTGERIGAQRAAHVRHDVMHVCVRLRDHVLIHAHAARLADAAEIIAFEVDEHDVLGPFLGMRHQFGGIAPVLLGDPRRARACRRWAASKSPGRSMRSSRSGDDDKMTRFRRAHARGERRRVGAAQRAINLAGVGAVAQLAARQGRERFAW